MRCPKCGYISFDHLDRCSKCQTDLTSERGQLNLLGVKPNPISLQEILDRDAQNKRKKTSRAKADSPIRPSKAVEPEGLEFLLEEGIALTDSISQDPTRPVKGPKVSRKEEGEIELSLEGLDLSLIPKKDL